MVWENSIFRIVSDRNCLILFTITGYSNKNFDEFNILLKIS